MRLSRVVVWLCALAVVLAPSATSWAWLRARSSVIAGVRVEGVAIDDARTVDATLTRIARAWLDDEITIDAGDIVMHASRRSLGARVSLVRAKASVIAVGRSGGVGAIVEADRAMRGDLDLSLPKTVEQPVLAAWLETLRDDLEIAPRSVEIDAAGNPVPARNGVMLDFVRAMWLIEQALVQGKAYVAVPTVLVEPPANDINAVANGIFTRAVAEYTTHYSMLESDRGRAINIERAAQEIDGAMLAPGATLSFNDRVGPRTTHRGFAEGPEILNGRLSLGVGGGICQTAATLHAAAFFGGLEIVEHHPHPRSSSYIPLGLDTSVSWKQNDLKIRNTHPYAVRVRASARAGVLSVSLAGPRRGPTVEWSADVIAREARGEVHVPYEADAARNSRGEIDDGEDGMRVRVRRTVYGPDGPYTDEWMHNYPPVPRVVVGD